MCSGAEAVPAETVSVEAIVLSTQESREDRVVTLLTPERGRIPAYARGAARSQRRFGAHIEPLTHVDAVIVVRREGQMYGLRQSSARSGFPTLKSDLLRLSLVTTMVETVLHLVPEHGNEPGVFPLVLRALGHLNRTETEATEDLLALFEVRLLLLAGLLPEVRDIAGLPETAIAPVNAWLQGHWEPLPEEARTDTCRALEILIQETSGRPLRSRPFLDELLQEPESA